MYGKISDLTLIPVSFSKSLSGTGFPFM